MAARSTVAEKAERDKQIVLERAAGLTVPTIAARHDLSERYVREILAQRRQAQLVLADIDPVGEILEAIEQHDFVIERLSLLASTAKHEAVALGALKAQLGAMRHKHDLLISVGLLPSMKA